MPGIQGDDDERADPDHGDGSPECAARDRLATPVPVLKPRVPPMPLLRAALLLCLCALCAMAVQAQEVETFQPRTGDAWIDRHLADMNDYAARYPQSFDDEISHYYSVPRDYVEALRQQPAWHPGDVFMACALAQVLAQPCRNLVREWSRDHDEGWQGVRQRVQGKPDPATTRELRKDIRESYQRWARPLSE
ncbi:MAG: hypothetical protein ABI858_11655 [Pseudoxanthomonas sp.]